MSHQILTRSVFINKTVKKYPRSVHDEFLFSSSEKENVKYSFNVSTSPTLPEKENHNSSC